MYIYSEGLILSILFKSKEFTNTFASKKRSILSFKQS